MDEDTRRSKKQTNIQTNRKPEREYFGKSEKDAKREEGRQRVRGVTPHSPLFISSCRDGTNPSMYWLVGGLRVRTGPARSITSGGDRRFRVPFKDKPTQMDTCLGFFWVIYQHLLIAVVTGWHRSTAGHRQLFKKAASED